MKRAGYLSLILILLMQSVGMLLFYQIRQYYVHYEMQKALNNDKTQFEKLTLTLSEYKKNKINGHEITLNGKMYDVKSVCFSGDHVELLVVNDTEEEYLLEKIKKTITTSKSQNSKLPNHLVTLLSLVYWSPPLKHDFLLEETPQNIFHSSCEIIFSHISEISSPPPKLV